MKRFLLLCTVLLAAPAAALFAAEVPAGHPAIPSSPAAKGHHGASRGAELPGSISGKVVETLNGGGYTYVRLVKHGKHIWVAMPQQPVRVGQRLTFAGGGKMENFTSKSLKRTFKEIYFCGPPIGKPAGEHEALLEKMSPGSKGAAVKAEGHVRVEKARGANAHTIAELYRLRSRLNGRQVTVRGKVVKVSAGIMGRNWIHLQDGTGSVKRKTFDLVVTSHDLPTAGEVVTVTGKLVKDRDFGAGYRYAVIVEEARISK